MMMMMMIVMIQRDFKWEKRAKTIRRGSCIAYEYIPSRLYDAHRQADGEQRVSNTQVAEPTECAPPNSIMASNGSQRGGLGRTRGVAMGRHQLVGSSPQDFLCRKGTSYTSSSLEKKTRPQIIEMGTVSCPLMAVLPALAVWIMIAA
jgi:hypothetical protein